MSIDVQDRYDERTHLWRAVIANAIAEADGQIVDGGPPRLRAKIIFEARTWLTTPSEDLTEACTLAGYDPEAIREASLKRFPTAEPPPARKSPRRGADALVEYQGRKHTVQQWASITGIHASVLHHRLNRGEELDHVFSKDVRPQGRKATLYASFEGEQLTLKQIAERTGITYATLMSRHRRGVTGEALFAPSAPQGTTRRDVRPGGGSELLPMGRDRRGTLRARDAQIGVFQS